MLHELLGQLNQLPDTRRGAGRRHPLGVVLLVAIMSVASGMWSYRAMGDFVKANEWELLRLLGVGRLPSYSTIRRVVQAVDFGRLSHVLSHWRRPELGEGSWLQLDGKALKATMQDYGEHSQDFVNVVSLFFGQQKAVLQSATFHNKRESEIKVVARMLRETDVKGAILTADALHAQKKPPRPS